MATAKAEKGRPRTTTITTPTDTEVLAVRTFDAPRELLWACHTDPRHVPHWMLGPEGWTMPVCEIDLRVGGRWHFVWRKSDGTEMEMNGVYREVVPPARLVNTEAWGDPFPETVNTTVFEEENGKTKVSVTMLFPSKKARDEAMKTGMEDGWDQSYDRLDGYIRSIR